MIARTALAQDDITGDGTTSIVLFIGDLMKQAERHIYEGIHPRTLIEGWDESKKCSLELLDTFKTCVCVHDRELLKCVAQTSIRTKVTENIAEKLADAVVDAILSICK